MGSPFARLGMSWTEAGLVVLTAAAVYGAMILVSRLFGQRQFTVASSYDLAITFAVGSVIGRVILVKTSLAAGLLGLVTLSVLHATTRFLHNRSRVVHRAVQNRPVLLALDGELVEANLRHTGTSPDEVFQQLRQQGHGSLGQVGAVVLERTGSMSVLGRDTPRDPAVFREVVTGSAAVGGSTGGH